MKKQITRWIVALLTLTMLFGTVAYAESYTATSQGFGGEVSVTVEVNDGVITAVSAVGDSETQGVGSRAIETLPGKILEAQSADIDGVSGCTYSSTAVLTAAKAAINEALGTATETASVKMQPGTYTGHGTGYGIIGQLALDVTVDESSIQSIEVNDSNRETITIFNAAFNKLTPRIIENQSLEIDGITGATSSSNGIKAAVADALTQALEAAGTDTSALDNFYVPVQKESKTETIDVDVVVVGMGSAGCAAAMSAAEAQAANGQEVSVLAIEQAGFFGGTSHLTGSPMGVNPTKYEEEYNNGEEYTDKEAFRQDWYDYAEGDAKTDLIDLFIDNSGDTIDWLVYDHDYLFCEPRNEQDYPFDVCMDFVFNAKKVEGYDYSSRTLGNRAETVYSYFEGLIEDYVELGGKYMLETKGTGFIYDDVTNRVAGVTALGDNGTEYIINAKAVIIGTGGFAGNKEMMETYVTEPTGTATSWPIFGYTINDGTMIEAAIDDLGAATYNIDMVPVSHYNAISSIMKDYPVTFVEGKTDSRWGYQATKSLNDVPMNFAISENGLWITTDGDRVVDESAFHVAWKLGANYWALWGQDTIDSFAENGFPKVQSTRAFGQGGFDANTPIPEMDEILDKCVEMGTLYRASSIEELAEMIGVDAETLNNVVTTYNAACESGEDTEMGKSAEYLSPITGDMYYAFKCINYTYGTDGGLDVDTSLNVLRPDGSVIDGLYAAGYDCSGVLYNSNKSYVDYGGAALGWGFTSGRLAGQNAVAMIAAE